MIRSVLTWLVAHRNKLIKAICGLSVAFLLAWGITLSCNNKKLSESLELALNNIEAYLGSLLESLLANNVLRLDYEDLQYQNDKLIHQLDSVRGLLKIKSKHLHTAATQTQVINVKDDVGVGGNIQVKDSIYRDSLNFNDMTRVYYSITEDSISIGLVVENTQYLYIFKERKYKHKKSFLKRLFTFDFKKVNTYKYNIINTNDIIKTKDVRVVEITSK